MRLIDNMVTLNKILCFRKDWYWIAAWNILDFYVHLVFSQSKMRVYCQFSKNRIVRYTHIILIRMILIFLNVLIVNQK